MQNLKKIVWHFHEKLHCSEKKSLIKIEKDLDDNKLLENVRKDKKVSNFLEKKSVFKHIIVKNKLINLIVK